MGQTQKKKRSKRPFGLHLGETTLLKSAFFLLKPSHSLIQEEKERWTCLFLCLFPLSLDIPPPKRGCRVSRCCLFHRNGMRRKIMGKVIKVAKREEALSLEASRKCCSWAPEVTLNWAPHCWMGKSLRAPSSFLWKNAEFCLNVYNTSAMRDPGGRGENVHNLTIYC